MNPNFICALIIGFAIFVVLIILRSKTSASGPPSLPGVPATMSDVERLIQAGETISAIRCYREIHHCGLLEAKDAVEKLREQIKG